MQLGETSRRHAPQAAVRPDLVVVRSPERHCHPGLMRSLEPALVQMLITEHAVEALDVAVLHVANFASFKLVRLAGGGRSQGIHTAGAAACQSKEQNNFW